METKQQPKKLFPALAAALMFFSGPVRKTKR